MYISIQISSRPSTLWEMTAFQNYGFPSCTSENLVFTTHGTGCRLRLGRRGGPKSSQEASKRSPESVPYLHLYRRMRTGFPLIFPKILNRTQTVLSLQLTVPQCGFVHGHLHYYSYAALQLSTDCPIVILDDPVNSPEGVSSWLVDAKAFVKQWSVYIE